MPEPITRGRRYVHGLDGLRAIAVLAVLAYHLGFAWAPGGLLGVGVFFTLSGYLITDILLDRLDDRGHISLGRFWLGRARRLLPALFAMLIVVTAWVTVFEPAQPPEHREAVAAAALYVNNWQQIFQDVSYFTVFEAPSPLNHLWSLAVEEQFYLLWPLVLVVAVAAVGERRAANGVRPRLAVLTIALALASAVTMAIAFEPSLDPSRAYYGTDTRAAELLIGAALAMIWPSRKLRADVTRGARDALDAIGGVALVVIALMIWRSNEFSPFLYRGGFLLLAIATAALVAALVHPACRLGTAIGAAPLRWIGVRSYGIYLWTFPIIVLTTPDGAYGRPDFIRNALQLTAILAVSAVSWRLLEQPIRRGAIGRAWERLRRSRARGRRPFSRRAVAVLAGVGLVFGVAVAGLAGANSEPQAVVASPEGEDAELRVEGRGSILADSEEGTTATASEPCTAVIHVGDSTSEGLTSESYLPDPRQRIDAQYARVGATRQRFAISGAMSIVETYRGNDNAAQVASDFVERGYEGCWVLALGTNDTANVVVGPQTGRAERIDQMMSVIGDQPVLWVTVKSLQARGPYANENMELWNEALVDACARYPNMRIFDWASQARDDWFIEDGIHYTTPGYAARGRLIAQALGDAFGETADECAVGEGG